METVLGPVVHLVFPTVLLSNIDFPCCSVKYFPTVRLLSYAGFVVFMTSNVVTYFEAPENVLKNVMLEN